MGRYADNNIAGFSYAARLLRREGNQVFNPGEHGEERLLGKHPEFKFTQKFRRAVLYKDCRYICKRAQAVAFLPGWEHGRGARMEWHLAVALGLKIIYLPNRYVKGWKP